MVIIHNWSKPKNCHNCPFNQSDCWCSITKDEIDRDDYTTQVKCPIDEVNFGTFACRCQYQIAANFCGN